MDTNDCIRGRRSIRRYTRQPIERETLEKIVSLASYAPSWKNTQVARYTFVTDRAVIEKIANECVLGFTHNTGILLSCNVLAVQSVVVRHSGYERDGSFSTAMGTHWESFDAGISAQTFCLAAHEFGVGTCILGVFDAQRSPRQSIFRRHSLCPACFRWVFPPKTPPRRRAKAPES